MINNPKLTNKINNQLKEVSKTTLKEAVNETLEEKKQAMIKELTIAQKVNLTKQDSRRLLKEIREESKI